MLKIKTGPLYRYDPSRGGSLPVLVTEVTRDRVRVVQENDVKDLPRPLADAQLMHGSRDYLRAVEGGETVDRTATGIALWLQDQSGFDSLIPGIECLIADVLTPDLLNKKWAKRLVSLAVAHPTAGHCYAAAEAAYHLLGGKHAGWVPRSAKYPEIDNRDATHWWIEREGVRCDPTREQFTSRGLPPPYEYGRGRGFLTKQPSKRAAEIMRRVCNATEE